MKKEELNAWAILIAVLMYKNDEDDISIEKIMPDILDIRERIQTLET